MHSSSNNGDETDLGETDIIDEKSFSLTVAEVSSKDVGRRIARMIQRSHKITQYRLEMH